ncbi:hypothetical protein WA158_001767 [Blastocystis sp. Blastoise]
MFSSLKKFDFHSKALEGLQSKSIFGGIITVISTTMIMCLLIFELRTFNQVKLVTNLNVDTVVDNRAPAKLNITLLHMKCSEVDFDFENLKVRPPENVVIEKIPYLPEEVHSQFDENKPELFPACRVEAEFDIFSGQGSFHIPIHSGKINFGDMHTHAYDRTALDHFNCSHVINQVRFGPLLQNTYYPLTNHTAITKNDINHYSYFIKIIPSSYIPLRGDIISTYQYSASVYSKQVGGMMMGNNVSPGIYFKYEFSPIHIDIVETKTSFFFFFTNSCAIIGGIITVSRMIQSFVHKSTSALYKTD